MKAANDLDLAWESVIFGEPTELKLATGHKGGLAFKLSAYGKAGHSGYPDLGRSAIDFLVNSLIVLHQLKLPGSERFGETTLNVGRIEGGVAPNVIAQDASGTVLVRVASEELGEIKARIQTAVLATSPWLKVEFLSYGIGPVQIDSDVTGFGKIIVNYGTDISSLKGSHKRYWYGPGSILSAHSAQVHINMTEIFAAVDGYRSLITQVLDQRAQTNTEQ